MSYQRDPASVLDFAFDWSGYLESGETISTHTVTATGATLDSSSAAAGVVTAWVSGGTAGTTATLQCEIVTSASRTDQRSISIAIRER